MESAKKSEAAVNFSDRLVNFIQRNRKILAGILIVIFVALVGVGIGYTVLENARKANIVKVAELEKSYEEIRILQDSSEKEEKVQTLIKELEKFAEQHSWSSKYSGARAYMTLATIHVDRKEWPEAEQAWLKVASISPSSYLAPVALYNAATAAEERGDSLKALELYTRCAKEYEKTFPLIPRVYFAIGRIQESQKNNTEALAAYEQLVEKWPNDNWTKLARSRILMLSTLK
ncbi:MAG: tetratricopeptide repeat protein [Breznakiellaceae bacterium]